ncbi:low molecular weight protein-tyrosine-phosphatase [Gephyromycinifex aptenodytis]|uniref:low molecular weight protein-tyrosine-phosphatase n=1 Tax=Gephyromycinifex aptenodytis TaxID=2716227 RepID=UPI0014483AB2|nr:low molecular weight protein-tyrosine-phosphatase [Gephyromycinifex aptenodytis]
MATPYTVCVVCSGNICRSPMGEVVLRARLEQAGLGDQVVVDSAGTGDWHVGRGADPRTVAALQARGYDGSAHRAKQFAREWYGQRDLILVADSGHLRAIQAMGPAEDDAAHVHLLRSFDVDAAESGAVELDDPYYSDDAAFGRCLREVEAAADGVVSFIKDELARR